MPTHFTNGKMNELLAELCFVPGEIVKRNRRAWRHPESGCRLLLPTNKLDERPQPADVVGVRAQLTLQGHLDEESFDYFVREGKLPAATPE